MKLQVENEKIPRTIYSEQNFLDYRSKAHILEKVYIYICQVYVCRNKKKKTAVECRLITYNFE